MICTALAWGTLKLIGLRIGASVNEESKWGFGQILPVLLSLLPLWSIYEKFSGRSLLTLTTRVLLGFFHPDGNLEDEKSRYYKVKSSPSKLGSDHHWSKLQLHQRTWFSKLIILIFGLAFVFAWDLLYNFPLGQVNPYGWTTDDISHNASAAVIVSQYAILLSISIGILFIFTSVCLAFQPKEPDPLQRTNLAHEVLWISLIVILVVGFFLFDWNMFDKPHDPILMNSWGYGPSR